MPNLYEDILTGAYPPRSLTEAMQEAGGIHESRKLDELDEIKQSMLGDQRESDVLSRQIDANIERIRAILGTH